MKKHITILTFVIISITAFANNWTKKTLDGAGTSMIKTMCAFNDNEALIAGYDSILYKTYDGGSTWNKISLKQFYPSGEYGFDFTDGSSKGDVVMLTATKEISAPGLIMLSTDKGENWTPILTNSFANDSAINKNPSFDGASNHRFYCIEVIDDSTAFTLMNWTDSTGTARNGIFKTINIGATWTYCNTPTIEGTPDGDIEFIGSTGYYAGSSKSYIFKTTDGGTTWVDYTDDSLYLFIWGFSLLSENELFVMGQDELYYYNTSDLTNPTITTLNKSFSYSLLALDANRVITFHKHDNIWASNNTDSILWESAGNGSTDWVRKCDMVYNDSIYALGDGAIFKAAVSDIFIGETTNIDNVKANEKNIKIYNANSELRLESSSAIGSVIIYSISGKIVLSKQFKSNSISIPTSSLQRGIYLIKADDYIKKLVL